MYEKCNSDLFYIISPYLYALSALNTFVHRCFREKGKTRRETCPMKDKRSPGIWITFIFLKNCIYRDKRRQGGAEGKLWHCKLGQLSSLSKKHIFRARIELWFLSFFLVVLFSTFARFVVYSRKLKSAKAKAE